MPGQPLVSVVDDDQSVRESLPDLLRTFGYASHSFSSGEEFLSSDVVDQTDCLVVDVVMPGMNGPALHDELSRRGKTIPIVFISAVCDGTLRPKVAAAGAVDCLLKPFGEAALLAAISAALRQRRRGNTKV
jgi:FixJ family two-component response regulator